MSEITVVKVTDENLPKLAEEMYMNPTYVEQVREMMANDLFVVFAAVSSGRYVGRCTLWLAPADEPEIRKELPGVPLVNALEIHPDYYRQGIASQLIRALEHEAKKRGKSQLALGVESQNTPARRLYEKFGFVYRTVCGQKVYVSSWEETQPDGSVRKYTIDTLSMVKELV